MYYWSHVPTPELVSVISLVCLILPDQVQWSHLYYILLSCAFLQCFWVSKHKETQLQEAGLTMLRSWPLTFWVKNRITFQLDLGLQRIGFHYDTSQAKLVLFTFPSLLIRFACPSLSSSFLSVSTSSDRLSLPTFSHTYSPSQSSIPVPSTCILWLFL